MRKRIETALAEYNRYHSPEATGRLLAVKGRSFTIAFTGSFCHTCGFYDYFDDFTITLKEKGLTVEVDEVTERDDGALVTFKREAPEEAS